MPAHFSCPLYLGAVPKMQRGRSPPKLAGDDDTGGPVTPTRVSSRNRNRSPVYQSATAKKLEEWVKKASFSPEHRNRSGSGSDSERAKESALRSFVALRSTGSFPGYSDDEEEDDEDEEHVHHDDDGDQHPHHHNDTKYSDGVLPLSGDGGDSTSHSQSESRRGSANQASGIEVQNQASVPERRASVDSTQLKGVLLRTQRCLLTFCSEETHLLIMQLWVSLLEAQWVSTLK